MISSVYSRHVIPAALARRMRLSTISRGADPEMVLNELPPGKTAGFPAASYTVMRGHSV
jgi:hypothetical protein